MERAGKLKLIRGQAEPYTPARQKFVDAAIEIALQPATKDDAAFMTRFLVQCTLPHSNPGPVEAWERRCGHLSLVIRPGWDREKKQVIGYPYGSIPRLLLYWIVTEAVRTQCRRLELGSQLSDFMRELGLSPDTGGGKRSDARRLREQMRRLFRSIISVEVTSSDPHRHGEAWLDMQVAPKGELWWDPKQPEQAALWGSWIELTDDFFQAITASVVPADMRALKALKRSPLALDLYTLMNYLRATAKTPKFISWTMLQQQLGSDIKDIDNFRRKALAALRKVKAVLPDKGKSVLHDKRKGGLSIAPGRPAIPRKSFTD
jgi:Plasmid encoded RepA protein